MRARKKGKKEYDVKISRKYAKCEDCVARSTDFHHDYELRIVKNGLGGTVALFPSLTCLTLLASCK
jgi:hypothetical protein